MIAGIRLPAVLLLLLLASSGLSAESADDRGTRQRSVKEQQRREAFVRKARKQIQTQLRRFKLDKESEGRKNDRDIFVIAKLSGTAAQRRVEASFATVEGVKAGGEEILQYLRAGTKAEPRDYRIISRHSDSEQADAGLAKVAGREQELANAIKRTIDIRNARYRDNLSQLRTLQLKINARSGNGRRC